MAKGRIVGIGGVFFKVDDPDKTKQWYQDHLGLKTDQWGAPFVFRKYSNPEEVGFTQWSPFQKDSDYFGDKGQDFMINYRVEHIEDLLEELKKNGCTICKELETYDYGKFVHIEDGNGLRMELWEPIDKVFEDMYESDSNLNKE